MKTNPITAMIVDDSKASINLLQSLLKEIQSISLIATATSADEALPLIVKREPDLLFLDVEMPSKTGFDLVEDLRRIHTIPIIIFTTAYEKYAINAIRCAAFDFLLKPIDPEELKHAVALATASMLTKDRAKNADQLIKHLKNQRRIKIPNRAGFLLLNPDDIYYIEADWGYSKVYLLNGTIEIVSVNLGQIESLLPAEQFFRISRAVLLHTKTIQRIDRKRKCALAQVNGIEKEFCISGNRLKELEKFDF